MKISKLYETEGIFVLNEMFIKYKKNYDRSK